MSNQRSNIEVFYNVIDDDTIKAFHAMALREKVANQMNEE
jgi:aromatic ring-cleaving dioxygenase